MLVKRSKTSRDKQAESSSSSDAALDAMIQRRGRAGLFYAGFAKPSLAIDSFENNL
jgi:hypothetical protein